MRVRGIERPLCYASSEHLQNGDFGTGDDFYPVSFKDNSTRHLFNGCYSVPKRTVVIS